MPIYDNVVKIKHKSDGMPYLWLLIHKQDFWTERRNRMAANTKKSMCSSSFDSVFVDDFNISFSIPKMSAFHCFYSVLYPRFL